MKDQAIFNLIEKFAKLLQIQLNLEFTYQSKNVATGFKGVSSFRELLIGLINENYVGSGSGGLGLDLIDLKNRKEIEVKTAVTFQPNKCQNCKFKFSRLFNQCSICHSQSFQSVHDSRFLINAKKLLEWIDQNIFNKIACVHIEEKPASHDFNNGQISFYIDCYDINFLNETKTLVEKKIKYFQNQRDRSNKSNNCNLIPKSFDFFILNPVWNARFEFTINYRHLNKRWLLNQNRIYN